MDGLALVVLVVGASWIAVLSLIVLLLVRQVALLNVRIERGAPQLTPRQGLMVGREVPAVVRTHLPEIQDGGVAYVLLMSAICGPCREVAPELRRLLISEPVIALIPGGHDAVRGLVAMMPPWIRVIEDPTAAEIARELQIDTTPFGFEIEFGMVTGKVFIHEARDLMHLIEARRNGARKLARGPMEVTSGARPDPAV